MNVQKLISEGIREQLYTNNFLVIPGFGGFVLKPGPAHFSASGSVLMPAGKTIGFNAQLKMNDGIMALWLAGQLNCSPHEALTQLQDFGSYCNGILQSRRRLNLDGIGFFYLDFENNICFEPQADVNFMTESFGLSPVYLKEIETTRPEPQRQPVFADRVAATPAEAIPSVTQPNSPKLKRRWMVPAAALVLIGVLATVLALNFNINGRIPAALFGNNKTCEYKPVPYPDFKLLNPAGETPAYVTDANGVAIIKLSDETTIAVKVVETSAPVKAKGAIVIKNAPAGSFEIVLGCFSIKSNAERMVKKLRLKQVDAYIAGALHKNMSVVCYCNFNEKEKAELVLSGIKSEFPKAWIRQAQ